MLLHRSIRSLCFKEVSSARRYFQFSPGVSFTVFDFSKLETTMSCRSPRQQAPTMKLQQSRQQAPTMKLQQSQSLKTSEEPTVLRLPLMTIADAAGLQAST